MDEPDFSTFPVFSALVPIMTKDRFSDLSGVSPEVLRGWLDRGYLPSMRIGKHRLINMVALVKQASEADVM